MSKSQGKFQRRVRSTPREYALYCSLRRALKQHRAFFAGHDGAALLLVPEGYDASDYLNAAKAELFGSQPESHQPDVAVMTIEDSDKHERIASYFMSECRDMRRLIIISEIRENLPAPVILAADYVSEIEPINERDLQAACKVVLKTSLSEDDAHELMQHPFSHVAVALRKGRSVKNAVERLHAIVDVKVPPGPDALADVTPLSGMFGYGPAKEWGVQLAQDLRDWKTGKIDWSDVDRGILLSGPPGVGKSVFARALAKECGVNLVATSLGQWQATGHLGDLLKAMRRDFGAAKTAAPSILFIDEIDSVGDRNKFSHDNKSYSVQVVNGLLECLDGLGGREGVVVVGATNNPGEIDAAVRRSGRLDRHIEIPMPSAEDRVAILSQHLGSPIDEHDVGAVQLATEGLSGADLSKIAREARRIARRAKRGVLLEDIRAALPPVMKIEGDHRYALAVHEAGHTVVGLHLKHGKYLGTRIVDQVVVAAGVQTGGCATFEIPMVARRDSQFYLNYIAVTLAGLAAEEIVLGNRGDGANSDLATASRLATAFEVSLGMGSSLVYSSANDDKELEELRRLDPALAERVDRLLQEQFERAKAILLERRDLLERLTTVLCERGMFRPSDLTMLQCLQGILAEKIESDNRHERRNFASEN